LIAVFFLCLASGFAQRGKSVFAVMEDSIVRLHRSMISERNSAIRYQQNEKLLYILEETLGLNNSISYPFDSLKTIKVLISPDKKVRVFTWYLIDEKGVHEHYGFLQAYNEKTRRYMVYPLIDKWQRVENPPARVLRCDNWFGALYTKLIEVKGSEKTYYTLLGWNGGNIFSQYKVIEVLSFNEKGAPVFGSEIFRGYGKNNHSKRIVFEYSKKGYMSLNYEKQAYMQRSEERDKRTRQYTMTKITTDMIVFSRLIPMQEGLSNPQFMVGEVSLIDAFVERDGKWFFKQDVIAGNPTKTTSKREQKTRVHYTPE
jgi:hypothetical protein